MKRIFYTLSLIAFTIGTNAQSFIDDFNYGLSAGNLTTLSPSWIAHSGVASNQVAYQATGLNVVGYTSSVNAGGAITFSHTASISKEDINKAISPAATSGNLYASFVLRVTASGGTTGDYCIHFIDSSGATTGGNFRARLFTKDGSTGTTFKLGLSKGSSAANATFTTADYNLNQDYIVVIKYSFIVGTANDTCYAHIFSSSIPAVEPAPAITTTNTTDLALSDLSKIASIAIRQGSVGSGAYVMDGLRISTSWTNAPLPVTWKSFTATKTADASALRWSTASETNNSHFEVQRSADGRNFEAIGRVKGTGNSSRTVNYSFTDREATTSRTTYYRLKQVDFDGKSEYSRTVSVSNTATKAGIGATLPNPFSSDVNITVNATVAASATVIIMDMIGKTHHTSTEQLLAGANTININTSDMPDGIYFVRVSYNGETFTQKIVKK